MSEHAANPTTATLGMIGSGFIARGILYAAKAAGYKIGPVLSRSTTARPDFPFADHLTDSLDELLEKSDLIIEASGDPIYVTPLIEKCLAAGKPVVTLDSEFHVTTGSYFVGKGLLTEAEGDQPGCIAALREEALSLGFKPLVYGNVKGYFNPKPDKKTMEYYSGLNGISIDQTTSFTDGTKVQIEQTFCANAFGADIVETGMKGLDMPPLVPAETDPKKPQPDLVHEGSKMLGEVAEKHGKAISEYIVVPGNGSVFVTATHADEQQGPLNYMKMGPGPYYTLVKPYHLCHLEVLKTVRNVIRFGEAGKLLDNSPKPQISVNSIAKRDLKAGEVIKRGIGSFDFRGEACRISENPNHLPIGLLQNAIITRDLKDGDVLTLDDVELPETRAFEIWRELMGL